MTGTVTREERVSSGALMAVVVAAITGLLLTMAALPATAAVADDIIANPECCSFAPGPFSQGLGETPNMVIPADADTPHNVVSNEPGPDGMPLFAAPANFAGTTTPVEGARYLEAGTYPFYCTLHGPTMNGELVVDGTRGKAVPRPKVKATYPAQKLKAIRKKGVRIRLTGVTDVPGTVIQVRLVGKGLIGEKSGIRLAAGQSRVFRFPLSKKLKKAIRKRRTVRFKASVYVDFGLPTTAVRKFK